MLWYKRMGMGIGKVTKASWFSALRPSVFPPREPVSALFEIYLTESLVKPRIHLCTMHGCPHVIIVSLIVSTPYLYSSREAECWRQEDAVSEF